jgi:hypothetical protein
LPADFSFTFHIDKSIPGIAIQSKLSTLLLTFISFRCIIKGLDRANLAFVSIDISVLFNQLSLSRATIKPEGAHYDSFYRFHPSRKRCFARR